MGCGHLHIDLEAVAANWRALDAKSSGTVETGAVVKANGYGLGANKVARRLAAEGARHFFVATAEEGASLRTALGPGPRISVFSGHMSGDTQTIAQARLTPMVNSVEQLTRHLDTLPRHPFGVQLDTGMNRLGLEMDEWAAVAELALHARPILVMSHLACADEPDHRMNAQQLAAFHLMTDGITVPRALAATGGTLLGPEYHFDLTRPGVGLYGGLPFARATPTLTLDVPVIQCRDVAPSETVGYGCAYVAATPTRIATISAGYADGLIRALSNGAMVYAGPVACPLAGRVSMDLITIDISHLDSDPTEVSLIGAHQSVDDLADAAGTIGYEILTSLSTRYTRSYRGEAA